MEYVLVFFSFWWVFVLVAVVPYLIIFFIKLNSIKREKKKRLEFYRQPIVTEDEKNLGIKIMKSEIETYKERIENLIITLNESNSLVTVNAVEAIMIVDLFSDSVAVNEDGELIISVKTAKKFSKLIYHNPMKFVKYIKAVETKIDITNKKNKVALSDVLYMMRNARKFGLYMESDETEFTYNIKSKIHESEYKNVIVRIVDDSVPAKSQNEANIILENVYSEEDEKLGDSASKNIIDEEIVDEDVADIDVIVEPLTPQEDNNILSVERCDDGKIKIITKDLIEIIKDDIMTYSITKPSEEEDNVKSKKVAHDKIKNSLVEKKDTTVEDYVSKFGGLDFFEEDNKERHLFKDRSKRSINNILVNNKTFLHTDFLTENFFDDADIFEHFLIQLFKMDNAINIAPYIFVGTKVFSEKKSFRFLTIDANYFFNMIYLCIVREDRESFFKFIYDSKYNLKLSKANVFLENIDVKYKIFFSDKNSYISDSIYTLDNKTIKSKIIRFSIDTIEKYLEDSEAFREIYVEIKSELDGRFDVKHFGVKAQNESAQIVLSHDTFFRLPISDRTINSEDEIVNDDKMF